MSNNTLIYLLIFAVTVMLALVGLNTIGYWDSPLSQTYLDKNDVRGIEIEYNKKLWTLNFEQQNKVIDILNSSIATNEYFSPEKSNFDKLIIYHFNKPDIVVTPLRQVNNQLVFSVPEWNQKGNLKESQAGSLQAVLSQTYDP